MKKFVEKLKEPKVWGVIVIIVGLVVIGSSVAALFSDDEEKPKEPEGTEEKISEEERQAIINDLPGTDEKDIESETAKKNMGLKVVIPDELKETYLGDRYERFMKEAEDFLVEYDFYMDVNKITCTQLITVDYKKNITYLEFKMDDSARSILTVEYHGNNDQFVFNFR